MANNSRGTGSSARKLERHTGADGILKFNLDDSYQTYSEEDLNSTVKGSTVKIPVTSVDWSRDFDTNDIQHNGGLNPTITTTGVRFEGSFEYTGQNPDLMEALARTNPSAGSREHRPIRGTMTVVETQHDSPNDGGNNNQKFTFERVLITSVSRDYPSDDSTTVTCDWEAEDMTHVNNN